MSAVELSVSNQPREGEDWGRTWRRGRTASSEHERGEAGRISIQVQGLVYN
jgi:hypothetical protein